MSCAHLAGSAVSQFRIHDKGSKAYMFRYLDCANRSMTGYTVDGTFCEYVIQAVDQVVPIPDSLPGPDATAIMCAVRTHHIL